MPLAAIRARVLEALDILQDLAAQVVFDLHAVEVRRQLDDLRARQVAHFRRAVDVEARQDACRGVVADAEEGLE